MKNLSAALRAYAHERASGSSRAYACRGALALALIATTAHADALSRGGKPPV